MKSDAEIAEYKEKLATTVRATLTSVVQDGKELDLNAAKVAVGDTEENGNLRLEIYNMYGPTAEDAAIEPDVIDFTESLVINFDIELAELSETEKVADTNASVNKDNPNHDGLIVGIVVAAVVLIAVAVCLVAKKKKK